MRTRTLNAALAVSLVLIGVVAFSLAGPLTPPAGPVASTYKTLTEVEPRTAISTVNTPGDAVSVYVLSQTGSYYLTANFTVPSGKSGIRIAAPNVTLDLNGFTISGASGSLDGVTDSSGALGAHVHNGHVSGLGRRGIALNFAQSGVVSGITALNCGLDGVTTASDSAVECCTAVGCPNGINAGFDCTVQSCTARLCTNYGIGADGGSIVDHCTADSNTAIGFRLFDSVHARGCTAIVNGGFGFSASDRCDLFDCHAAGNSSDGINAGSYCNITGCHSTGNTGDGIQVTSYSVVRSCTCQNNTAAGILLTATFAVVEDNVCILNQVYGVRITGANCFAGRNVVSSNTVGAVNYSFVAGTRFGDIINLPAGAAAVSVAPGAAAAGTVTGAGTYANLSY